MNNSYRDLIGDNIAGGLIARVQANKVLCFDGKAYAVNSDVAARIRADIAADEKRARAAIAAATATNKS